MEQINYHDGPKDPLALANISAQPYSCINIAKNNYHTIKPLGNPVTFSSLKQLNIGHNLLRSIIWLDNFPHLINLIMNSNRITRIPNLPNLTSLNASSNKIKSIDSLSTTITTLNLSNNLITDTSRLRQLTKLRQLNISYNVIRVLSHLPHSLDLLIANYCCLDYVPAVPIYLTALDLSMNKIKSINLTNCMNLVFLNLSNNELVSINLQNHKLENVNLSNNQLISCSTLSHLTRITNLDLSNNMITSFEPIERLVNMSKLNCSGNKFSCIDFTRRMTRLKELKCSNCGISEYDLSQNVELENVNLSNNQLISTNNLFDLLHLKELDLKGNNLTELPVINDSILVCLDISHNKIKDIYNIYNLLNLTLFNCSNNEPLSLRPILSLVRIPMNYDISWIKLRYVQYDMSMTRLDVQLSNYFELIKNGKLLLGHDSAYCLSGNCSCRSKVFIETSASVIDLLVENGYYSTFDSIQQYSNESNLIHPFYLVSCRQLLVLVQNKVNSIGGRASRRCMKKLKQLVSKLSGCKCTTHKMNQISEFIRCNTDIQK